LAFFGKSLVFHPAQENPIKFFPIGLKFFFADTDTYDYMSEVVLSFFENLTFFFLNEKNI
jgi:hypothetical protein